MPIVQVNLTAEQLAAAYAQLEAREQRSFMRAIFNYPSSPETAQEFIAAAETALARKFTASQQRRLNELLDKNAAGALAEEERQRLDETMNEYGAGLLEKARARYALHLAQQTAPNNNG